MILWNINRTYYVKDDVSKSTERGVLSRGLSKTINFTYFFSYKQSETSTIL